MPDSALTSHRINSFRIPRPEAAQRLPGRILPNAEKAVTARGDDAFAVGRKRDIGNRRRVPPAQAAQPGDGAEWKGVTKLVRGQCGRLAGVGRGGMNQSNDYANDKSCGAYHAILSAKVTERDRSVF